MEGAGPKVIDLVVQGRARPIDHRETTGEGPAAEGTARSFPIPANEPQRLAALRALDILDTAPEIAYDEIAELAAQICGCPVAYISFIDDDRRWLKAKYGLPPRGKSRRRARPRCARRRSAAPTCSWCRT